MASTTEAFDPVKAGFRVATGPIERKPRRPSNRPQPKPQYADSVWWSFNNDQPLEVSVPVRSVEDTVRKLKRAARYLERTKSTASRKIEVRVQIGVEPDPDKAKNSVVKFLGHKPWALGRRIAKIEADAREAGAEAGEQAAADALARVPAQAPRHRRTTAATRAPGSGRHSRASLRDALVWSVITPQRPSFPVTTPVRGSLCFSPAHTEFLAIVSRSLLLSYPGGTMSSPLQKRWGSLSGASDG
jgi:hypothetical protein